MSELVRAEPPKKLKSEEVGAHEDGLTVAGLLLIAVWWPAVLVWYRVFGILLVPYRILCRSACKRKAEALRVGVLIGWA
jgi:hypothetical protein